MRNLLLRVVPVFAFVGCFELAPCGADDGASAPACSTELPCADGLACVEGSCVLPPARPCEAGADACEEGELCRPPAGVGCGTETSCPSPLVCARPIGPTPGRFACARDAECQSGLCLEGVCLQPCAEAAPCGVGFECVARVLRTGAVLTACVGLDRGGGRDPGRALCRTDGDCLEGRRCRLDWVIGGGEANDVVSTCEPGERPPWGVGSLCGSAQDCPSGICSRACSQASIDEGAFFCAEKRCARLCERDTDCPSPLSCGAAGITPPVTVEGVELAICVFAKGGCLSDDDCCPYRQAEDPALCVGGWSEGPESCTEVTLGGRVVTTCDAPEGLAPRGEGCASDQECASERCVDGACASLCTPADGAHCLPTSDGVEQLCRPIGAGDERPACLPAH